MLREFPAGPERRAYLQGYQAALDMCLTHNLETARRVHQAVRDAEHRIDQATQHGRQHEGIE